LLAFYDTQPFFDDNVLPTKAAILAEVTKSG
jgi:hypothetical protein